MMNPRTHTARHLAVIALMALHLEARAVEFEKLGTSLAKALGSKKVFKTTVDSGGSQVTVYYAKGSDGNATRYAVVQKDIYEPNCTHTWVIATDKAAKIDSIRVVEMSCPHAFPTNQASFLDQYKGKGPADVDSLKGQIHTVAKATGSSDLTTNAVIRTINAVKKVKGS